MTRVGLPQEMQVKIHVAQYPFNPNRQYANEQVDALTYSRYPHSTFENGKIPQAIAKQPQSIGTEEQISSLADRTQDNQLGEKFNFREHDDDDYNDGNGNWDYSGKGKTISNLNSGTNASYSHHRMSKNSQGSKSAA